jgi:Flp pilus assembly protein TadG
MMFRNLPRSSRRIPTPVSPTTRAAAARSGRPRRRGAAIAEFAVVVPILILLVFGMLEFSRVMMVQEILVNAAREGCRKATLPGSTSDNVNTVVSTYLTNSGISGAPNPTINPTDPSTANAGDPITVTVSVPFNNVSWLPVPMFLGGKTLSATVVMAKESNNT